MPTGTVNMLVEPLFAGHTCLVGNFQKKLAEHLEFSNILFNIAIPNCST
nr:MAG TPA: hypothetical protein [Microviridae sp.]